jgi:DNA sulfur modification protein DndC
MMRSGQRWRDRHSDPNGVVELAIARVQHAYVNDSHPWFLGFSGGKDSAALATILFEALRRASRSGPLNKPVTLLYCDTGVEIPVMAQQARRALRELAKDAAAQGLPIRSRSASPALGDRFFVKVIGRGYPPPTNKFRWCTSRLRIEPVRRVLDERGIERATVLLGVRKGESVARDRTVLRHRDEAAYYLRQDGSSRARIFAPLLDFSLEDVWGVLFSSLTPNGMRVSRLGQLYRSAGGECPILKAPESPPCGSGRFGCWTCTVVRTDRAVTNLVADGEVELGPLLAFRNWLAAFRDDPTCRCRRRRNGARGPGPFTIAARKLILAQLRKTQAKVPWTLIHKAEIREIHRCWRVDRRSASYREH